MSDPSAPSSKPRKLKSRKKCSGKQIMAQDLWPSIRLHGIKLLIMLHGIKHQGIRPFNIKPLRLMYHGTRHLSISGLISDLYLPIIVANPRTNPSPLKGRRKWKMINTAESHLFWMQSMMEWMGQLMKSCQQPPIGRQAWVRKKEDVHPMKGNRLT
jgi:hypothetical protein